MYDFLFAAFTISSQVWMFDSRESMVEFFCDQLAELDRCMAVVMVDSCCECYKMKENVLHCKYLRYQPRTLNVVSTCRCEGVKHDTLLMTPYAKNSVAYVFLRDVCEEELQVLKDTILVLARAIESLEMRMERERILRQLVENLRQFEFLADRLRNPLAVILGMAELEGEVDTARAFHLIRKSAYRIKRILDELTVSEIKTQNIICEVSAKRLKV